MSEEFVVNVTLPGTPEHFTRSCHDAVTVGRGPEADIQLVHPMVSRRHAQMTLQDDGSFLVRDLGSRNGTIVNDEMLQEVARSVSAPAVVQVGPYVLRLTPASLIADETVQGKSTPATSGRVALDRGLHVLLIDGNQALEGLTGLEYRLMDVLTSAGRRLVPNQQLGDALWGAGSWDAYMLHNLVRRVRRKLEEKGLPADELILSVPGGGYRVD
jgi:pSer/pThr/pTyr-binding forkhead associated (FHA) protein